MEQEEENKNKNIIKKGQKPPINASQEIKNDINENNFLSKIKILLINLEAKNANIYEIKTKLKIIFEENYDKNKDNKKLNENNEIKKDIIDRVFNTFKDNLEISEEDKTHLKNLIIYLYEQNDTIDEFQNYLDAILENYIDFSKLGKNKANIIFNYIVDFMQNDMMKEKRKKLNGENENKNENKKDNEKDNIYKKIK